MHVGVCRMTLHIPQNRSLKGKRQVVQSLCGRLRSHFAVSVAEVGDQDLWQSAVIGIVTVDGEPSRASAAIDRVIEFTETNFPDVQVVGCERDVLDLT
jgi:uncharacterized protein YlxP (DUF503 family)